MRKTTPPVRRTGKPGKTVIIIQPPVQGCKASQDRGLTLITW